MSTKDDFIADSASPADKNARIAELLGRADAVSDNLHTLVSSIELSPAYTAYVLNATTRGVTDYLEKYGESWIDEPLRRRDSITSRMNPQALHDCIMARAPEINAAVNRIRTNPRISETVDVAPSATVQAFHNASSYERGWHNRAQIEDANIRTPQFFIKINAADRTYTGEALETLAHETAHHIELKLALIQHWAEHAVPEDFREDAEYFHSLHVKGAYINGEKNHSLYQEQANERLARTVGAEARNTANRLGFY